MAVRTRNWQRRAVARRHGAADQPSSFLFPGRCHPAATGTGIYVQPVVKAVWWLPWWRLYRMRHTQLSRIWYSTRDTRPAEGCKLLNYRFQACPETGIW